MRIRPILTPVILLMTLAITAPDRLAQAVEPKEGTIITKENWQQYREYMPEGMQALLEGKYFWKAPEDVRIEVGQTVTRTADPREYVADTERYASQVGLSKVEGGGIAIQNYTAGLPFPDPKEPDLGAKIFYNNYYRYNGPHLKFKWHAFFVDRFLNETFIEGYSVYTKLAYLSEPGQPKTMPGAGNLYYSTYQEMGVPEQSKYTAQLLTYYQNVKREEDNYVFVPSLRRSLRLSSAARCSPVLGTDWTPEDLWRVPGHFAPEFLREQKILAIVNAKDLSDANFERPLFWPSPKVGKWELRDVYVIDAKRAPGFVAGYCFGGRHLYVDKKTWVVLWTDTYDVNNKLYKLITNFRQPAPLPGDEPGLLFYPTLGNDVFTGWDVQNNHLTATFESDTLVNADVPEQYRDIRRYALPAGLNEVMR